MEIDTTEQFNSPFKLNTTIENKAGLLKWVPPLNMQDSMVYYWRVSPDSISPQETFIWSTANSFIYLPSSEPGWNQSHFYQYDKNELEGLTLERDKKFSFGVNGFFIGIRNHLYNPADPPAYIFNLGNAAASVRPWNLINAGVAVVVGDSITGSGWLNSPGGLYGSVNSGTTRVFSFPTNTSEQRELLITFLEDIIPDNNYVFLFTVQRPGFSFEPETWSQDSLTFGKTIFSVLEDQGAQSVRELETKGTVPYTFIYQKNNNALGEDIAATLEEQIFTEVFVPISQTVGNMRSTIVGPAKEWKNLVWNVSGGDNSITDTTYLSIFGLDENQNEILLVDRLFSKDTTLNFIDANV